MEAKVSLKLSTRSADDKVEFARGMVTAMTGNASFTSPSPALATVSSAATDLENAIIAAQDGGKSKTALMHAKEVVLDNILTQLGLYVEATANGDDSVILSSGANARHTKGAPQVPAVPANVNAATGVAEGAISLNWETVKNARVYVVEQLDDASTIQSSRSIAPVSGGTLTPVVANWHQVAIVTKSKISLSNLISGNKYAYRIYCVGAAGNGNYSTPVVIKVL